MLSESLNISTAAPSSNAATPQPWTADVEGRAGPIPVPAPMADTIIISEYKFMYSVHNSAKGPDVCSERLQEASLCTHKGKKTTFSLLAGNSGFWCNIRV